ncbi:MAG: alpha/beta hydrolase, partial [Acidobacteriaceae bacterium]|nr:alpha/beta hydrolase [Acidobacteriaceae bacterium]
MSTTVGRRPGTRPAGRTDRARKARSTTATAPSGYAGLSWRAYGYAVAAMALVFVLGALLVWRNPLATIELMTRARLAYAGFHNEYATIDGNRIHYYEGGSSNGTPVVLVHGLGSRAEDWSNLMPQLKDAGFHVYAIDLLGYGLSARPKDAPYSIPQEAGVVETFLAQQRIQKADLIGWSMGGWVAARAALDQPERIGRLVLCDAAGIRFAPNFTVFDFEPTTVPAVRRLYRLLMPQPAELPDFLARDMVRKFYSLNWVVD